MPSLGPSELLIVMAVLLLFCGTSRLPKLARSLGSARREFERGQVAGLTDEAETIA